MTRQLGEKQYWRKFARWDNVARCPLFIRDLAGKSAGRRCERVTSLLDIYPTLLELCGLPPRDALDGRSLVPLLQDPETPTAEIPDPLSPTTQSGNDPAEG